MDEQPVRCERSSHSDLWIGGSIILLALFLALPQIISTIILRSFVRMPEQFETSSDLFQVTAQIIWRQPDKLDARVSVENKTDRVIGRVWATARLDDSLEPLLPHGLDFNPPWIASTWGQLLEGLPPRYDLVPANWTTEGLQPDEIPGFTIGVGNSISAEGYSEAELGRILASPIKVKIWHEGSIQYLLVQPTVETVPE